MQTGNGEIREECAYVKFCVCACVSVREPFYLPSQTVYSLSYQMFLTNSVELKKGILGFLCYEGGRVGEHLSAFSSLEI